MLVTESRPRNLKWYHAGPLLFGDWGTSRLYVLGLAFYYTAHASIYYLAVMSLIMAAVAWGYTVVCRCFPDGGGVYSAARQVNPLLSVIAATLLLCDFIVTAAISAIEGFHYFGVDGQAIVVLASIGTMIVLGAVNWFGARAAGRFALVIAIAAIVASSIIGALCLPLLPEGLRTAKPRVEGIENAWQSWESLVRIVLALSGVEAVASMTGLMKPPVEKTSKRTIWPVLIEVIVLNVIFCVALNALPGRAATKVPDYVTYEQRMGLSSDLTPERDATEAEVAAWEGVKDQTKEVKEYRQTAVKEIARFAGGRALGEHAGNAVAIAAGIVFGLLLISAANTAILAMVSVFFALAQDGELPKAITKLNYSGVPWFALVLAVGLPCGVLAFVHDDKALGELYAIGVVGAIAINMTCCAWNKGLAIGAWERRGLWALAVVMTAIEVTIIVAKPNATAFAGGMLAVVLGLRWAARARAARKPFEPMECPAEGWLHELQQPAPKLAGGKPRIMLAARGQDQAEYAVDLARKRGAILFAIYVRTLRLIDVMPGQVPKIEHDPRAQQTLGTAAVLARRAGVPFFPIYVTSTEIAHEILDYTATFGCDTLVMGKSRRNVFARAIEGDVLKSVAENLPEGVALIARASRASVTRQPTAEREGEGKKAESAADEEEPPPS